MSARRPPTEVSYHPVLLAIMKAEAAAYLVGELDHGDLGLRLGAPLGDTAIHQHTPEDSQTLGWLKVIAHEALVGALEDARAAVIKEQEPKAVAP